MPEVWNESGQTGPIRFLPWFPRKMFGQCIMYTCVYNLLIVIYCRLIIVASAFASPRILEKKNAIKSFFQTNYCTLRVKPYNHKFPNTEILYQYPNNGTTLRLYIQHVTEVSPAAMLMLHCCCHQLLFTPTLFENAVGKKISENLEQTCPNLAYRRYRKDGTF